MSDDGDEQPPDDPVGQLITLAAIGAWSVATLVAFAFLGLLLLCIVVVILVFLWLISPWLVFGLVGFVALMLASWWANRDPA